jgi:hypothetical protein
MEGTMNHLQLVRHLAARLNLILLVYGERMKRAEEAFRDWQHTPGALASREQFWTEYLWQSDRASRLHARHSRIARRAVGISRG